MAKKRRLAVSGDRGSFSEEAGILYAKKSGVNPDIVFATDMEGALEKVENGEAELGIFPVVNSRGGLVETAFEAMGRHRFTLVDQFPFDVRQCLMALPDVSKQDVTEIVSHPQALSQCAEYLLREFPGVPLKAWIDTAKAAEDLASGVLPNTAAVIAPSRAASIHGLSLIAESIQDNNPNLTTFIVVKKYET